jgi:hypothetical protein
VKKLVLSATVAVAAAVGGAYYTRPADASQAAAAPQEQVPAAPAARLATDGLSDLDAMTFSCPKAGLNAAAREAAKVRSQGTYQFSYFRIVNDAHHAAYEVHFRSNYHGEPDLKYCVALYCQQGWDPKTTRADVTLMGSGSPAKKGAAHAAMCSTGPAPVQRRPKG